MTDCVTMTADSMASTTGVHVQDGALAALFGHPKRHHGERRSVGVHHRAIRDAAPGLEIIESSNAGGVRRHGQPLAALSLGDGVVEYAEGERGVRQWSACRIGDEDL